MSFFSNFMNSVRGSLLGEPLQVQPQNLANLKDKVMKQDIASEELLEVLSTDFDLSTCFNQLAGVAEGYTVKEHTKRVLDLAIQYQESLKQNIEPMVTFNEFLVFLALHDIGKGISKEEPNPDYSAKKWELVKSQEILKSTLQKLQFSEDKIAILSSMLLYDSQGDYLQFDIVDKTLLSHVKEMARQTSLQPADFYKLYSTFHLVDAASYPSLQNAGFFVLKETSVEYSEAYQSLIDEIKKQLN